MAESTSTQLLARAAIPRRYSTRWPAACSLSNGIRKPAIAARRSWRALTEGSAFFKFGDLSEIAARCGLRNVNGIAFDLGISSLQLDVPERGFSFRLAGPLDMRMDTADGTTAGDAVNHLPQDELANILYTFGEERASRRIAAAIVRARVQAPILDTLKLADIVRSVLPRSSDGLDPATRTFQALRIWVNDELAELDRGLVAAERLLAPGGRLVVVAFHSLEDRKVKNFLRLRSGEPPRASRHRPGDCGIKTEPSFRLLNKRAVRPSPHEIAENPRARSARMRARGTCRGAGMDATDRKKVRHEWLVHIRKAGDGALSAARGGARRRAAHRNPPGTRIGGRAR